MWQITDDLFLKSRQNEKWCCKYCDGEGKIAIDIRHDEMACIVKIDGSDNLLRHWGIEPNIDNKPDCAIVYTSCKFRLRPIIIFCELKVSKKDSKLNDAKKQLRNLIRRLKALYKETWQLFCRENLIAALIVHDRPTSPEEELFEGIRLFYLRNPVSGSSFRKKVISKIERVLQ
jgi:hypothetical protein